MNESRYVLMTAAHNEEANIARTLDCVTEQTHPPRLWTIVSDASTDGTDDIVKEFAARFPYIRLIRRERQPGRDFGMKVHAVNAAFASLREEPFDFVGNLDADVSFGPDYFERLLAKFDSNPRLGIGGGVTFDFYDGAVHARHASLDSVGGAVQMFRRACYESVGGYRPLAFGSEDALALHMARWMGWETASFPDLPVMHHRETGTASWSIWRTRLNQGIAQGIFGWHPWFVLCRAVYRAAIERPYVLGALVRTGGFCWGHFMRERNELPKDLRRYIAEEQARKLRAALTGRFVPWRRAHPGRAK